MKDYGLYINGEWSDHGLEKIEVRNPATDEIVATVPKGGATEAAKAADAAYAAFTDWSALSVYERSDLIWKWHKLIDDHKEELARQKNKANH